MDKLIDALLGRSAYLKTRFPSGTRWQIAALAAASITAFGQTPAPQTQPATAPPVVAQTTDPSSTSTAPNPTAPANPPAPANTPAPSKPGGLHSTAVKDPLLSAGAFSIQTTGGEIKEDQLKQMLVGKSLYLRAGYQENNLEFDEQGRLLEHSPQGSFTLSEIQVNKVRLSKHKLELEGDRYALHFLGAAPYEDPTKATDRVKITPKKKTVRVSFDREQVETPKKKKEKDKDKRKHGDQAQEQSKAKSADAIAKPETADTSEAVATDAANPASGQRSDDKKSTTTTSPAQASQLLLTALDKVFSRGIDDRMVAAMPDFWKSYYQAAAQKVDYKPTDPGVFAAGAVDQKAKLVSVLDPPSNELAQANGVAGIAMYHAIVGSDGKVEEVVAGRPIGFGLDESAEQSIRKAVFQPAVKDGKPVPVALDLVVSFRIYSKRTSEPAASPEAEKKPDEPALPGPYTLQAEEAQARAAQQAGPPQQPTGQAQPQPDSAQPPPAPTQPQADPPRQQPSPAEQTPQ